MAEKYFEGIYPVLSLPFSEDMEIDYSSLRNLIDFCIDKKAHGIVIFGVASEFYKITDQESKKVIEITAEHVNGRIPLLAGVGRLSTYTTIIQAKLCQSIGFDGVIIFPPYFIPIGKEQLFKHYIDVANSTELPVIIQDAPQVSGVNMDVEFFIRLSEECSNIKYAKIEAPFGGPKISAVLSAAGDRFKIFDGGGGIYFLEHLMRGVSGLMPGCAVVDVFVDIYKKFIDCNIEEAEILFKELLPLLNIEGQAAELFVACEKEMLKYQGIITSATSRNPWVSLDKVIKDMLIKNLKRLITI